MKTMFRSFAFAAGLAGAVAATGAQAQDGAKIPALGGITANLSASIATDYTSRGLSQTRKNASLQATYDFEHASGVYVGGFLGNIDFNLPDGGMEADFSFGWRHKWLNEKLGTDIGFTRYTYPAADAGLHLTYNEFLLKLSYDLSPITLVGTGTYSPQYQGKTGSEVYLEGGLDYKTPLWDIVTSGRVGHQWVRKNILWNAPDYTNWSLALAKDLPGGFTFSVGYYDTSISKRRCFPGSGLENTCDGRVIAGVTWKL